MGKRWPTKARLWHLGVPLSVGLAAALLSLTRARRPVRHAPAAELGQASQGLDSAVARRSGQVTSVRRSSGLHRLALWAAARVGWILVVAGLGVWSLAVAIGQSHEVNPPLASASATVISERIDDSDPMDKQIWVDVWFRTKLGRIARSTIQPYPYTFGKVVGGQKLPIRYNEIVPSQAVYAGLGGDGAGLFDAGALKGPAYFGAAVWFSLAVVLLLTGLSRLIGIMRAALTSVATPVRLRTSGEMVHADNLAGSYSLEWRILPGQPDISGDVRILGEPGRRALAYRAPGRWSACLAVQQSPATAGIGRAEVACSAVGPCRVCPFATFRLRPDSRSARHAAGGYPATAGAGDRLVVARRAAPCGEGACHHARTAEAGGTRPCSVAGGFVA